MISRLRSSVHCRSSNPRTVSAGQRREDAVDDVHDQLPSAPDVVRVDDARP